MGCSKSSKNATAPHFESWSIIQASRVTCPSRSGLPPKPTERLVKSLSVTATPFCTASKALPPDERIDHAPAFASIPWFHVLRTRGNLPPKALDEMFSAMVLKGVSVTPALARPKFLRNLLLDMVLRLLKLSTYLLICSSCVEPSHLLPY